ncbi:MAG: hypothetical protein K6G33_05315, partial [Ruminococcus sp.]|uniref:hypothetical protein n=1 Tax=Ruminococcus sp. TaxID=41978 RepID=UPI0025E94AAA
ISIAIATPCSSCTQALSLIIQDFYFSGSFFYYHFEANWLSFILAYIGWDWLAVTFNSLSSSKWTTNCKVSPYAYKERNRPQSDTSKNI